MELASACHLRVAEPSTYFGLPEAQRGIFVGGGGSVRIPRLIGVSRMTDMMLTGRLFDAAQAEAMGLVNYTVPAGTGWAKALELAERVASNAPLSNFAVTHALPRIADQPHADGLLMESLMAALVERGDLEESFPPPRFDDDPEDQRNDGHREQPTPRCHPGSSHGLALSVTLQFHCHSPRIPERELDGSGGTSPSPYSSKA